MAKKATALLILGLFLLAAPAFGGGWAVITLDELPAEVRAGEPVTVRFLVRQHGVRPVEGANVVVRAQHPASGERLAWTAEQGEEVGRYTLEAIFPQPGEWLWQVTAEPFPQATELPPLHVLPAAARGATDSRPATAAILLRVAGLSLLGLGALLAVTQRRRPGLAAGLGGGSLLFLALVIPPAPAPQVAAAPSAQSMAERGAALFQAKGCVACHQHEAMPAGDGPRIGPDLSHYEPAPEFVRAWLRGPAAIRPNTQMPNMELDDAEIEALLAFLAEGSKKVETGQRTCPMTRAPLIPFRPGKPFAATAPGAGNFWYGTRVLWAMLRDDGVWDDLPHHEHGYTQKLPLWSEGYNWQEEQDPELVLTGRQLDGDAVMADAGASNAYHPDYGSFIMTGFVLPASGCWEITAEYRDATLSFVVWVEP